MSNIDQTPPKLPPEPKIHMDAELRGFLSEADKLIHRLEGAGSIVSFPAILTAALLKESFYSNLIDEENVSVQNYFAEDKNKTQIDNYITAIDKSVKLLKNIQSPIKIIKGIHKELLFETEDSSGPIGEFRTTENWIGKNKLSKEESKYVSPTPESLDSLLNDLEEYIIADVSFPPLINAALIHAQFEMIHPFFSENGKVGRILILLHLVWKKRISAPLLIPSYFLYKNKVEYFDRLHDVSTNKNWGGWIKFFVRGIIDSANHSLETAKRIIDLREKCLNVLVEKNSASSLSINFVNHLFEKPYTSIPVITKSIKTTKQTANPLTAKFLELGIVKEITGQQRNRIFVFQEYLDILTSGIK